MRALSVREVCFQCTVRSVASRRAAGHAKTQLLEMLVAVKKSIRR
jgi:hypothetical protein